MKRSEMLINELDALNTRAFLPFEWMWNLPIPAFIKEKRAAAVLVHFFEELIEKHKVNKEKLIENLFQFFTTWKHF